MRQNPESFSFRLQTQHEAKWRKASRETLRAMKL